MKSDLSTIFWLEKPASPDRMNNESYFALCFGNTAKHGLFADVEQLAHLDASKILDTPLVATVIEQRTLLSVCGGVLGLKIAGDAEMDPQDIDIHYSSVQQETPNSSVERVGGLLIARLSSTL